MGDEISEEQLLEFCHRLGLAMNGYLDEKDLNVVCKCIGVEVHAEKIKELFEELDGDKDGKICVSELSQMFRGMQNKMPGSPERNNTRSTSDTKVTAENTTKSNGHFPVHLADKGVFTVLDPDNTGFTKVGCILDLWSQLGISQDNGLHILNDMGFHGCSRSNSVNIQVLIKSIEDDLDHFNDIDIPLPIQIALLTYRTEAKYLRSVCEGVETERDKLKQDIFDAHQRSILLAQEIDEQNARLEKNNQALLQKMETKYIEQIHELQRMAALDKESMQQTIQSLESQQNALREEESRLRNHSVSLTQENLHLEQEVQILNKDVRNVNRLKEQLQREVSRFMDLENKLIEMEKRNSENLETCEIELRKANSDVQTMRDQNDELSVRLEIMKEALHSMKASEEKRYYVKRRKGLFCRSGGTNMSENNDFSDENHDVPLEKVGKYNRHIDVNNTDETFLDEEEQGSSMDSLPHSFSQPNSGNFPVFSTISLAACMGESSTDHIFDGSTKQKISKMITPGDSRLRLDPDYKSLENEMDSVKQKIVIIITEKEQLVKENNLLRNQHYYSNVSKWENVVVSTQTSLQDFPEREDATLWSKGVQHDNLNVESLTKRITELEEQLVASKTTLDKGQKAHQTQCEDLEKTLELLQVEYEKCEDYWHGKLQEARDEYELDRNSSDDKFQELALKIQEYEDMFLKQVDMQPEKLPPIAECANLERQVNDLEDECQTLRNELVTIKIAHESAIESFQRKYEAKVAEECGSLEHQVSALTKKCHEYESRLSTLADDEKCNMEDTGILNMLKDRIHQLETELKNQDDKNHELVQQLDRIWKEKGNNLLPRQNLEGPTSSQIILDGRNLLVQSTHNKGLLAMFHQPKYEPTSLQCAEYSGRSASLPYFSAEEPTCSASDMSSPPNYTSDIWNSPPPLQNKKAWCHVELGWLQALRSKLRHRDEQCIILQRTLFQKDFQTEKFATEIRQQHAAEISNWESLLKSNQELNRQHSLKCREQAEKLAQADLVLKDLWLENSKLMAALNTTEQRVIQLENLLKFQMNMNRLNKNSNDNTSGSSSSQHSLPHMQHHFNNN